MVSLASRYRIASDNFSFGGNFTQLWQSVSGYVGNKFRGAGSTLNFTHFGTRQAITKSFNLSPSHTHTVSFDLTYGNGRLGNGGEDVDPGETVSLQVRTNNGAWQTLQTTADDNRYGSHRITATVPQWATGQGQTQFRWVQQRNSGSGFDEWALDNVSIDGVRPPFINSPHPSPVLPVVNPGPTTVQNTQNTTTYNNNQSFNISVNGSGNTFGAIGTNSVSFDQVGSSKADTFSGNPNSTKGDMFKGGGGNDKLTGYRGADVLMGDAGDDILRGGNGKDVLSGGAGADVIYGGFGQNTFTGEKDGSRDQLYFKSDKYANNWIYNKANNQDGTKVDLIGPLDNFDQITVQGVSDSLLTYGSTSATVNGNQVNGIGIFAGGTLEAVYTGGNLTAGQLDQMTTGSLFA